MKHQEAEVKKIYEVSGKLQKGFVGQISYSVCLEEEYQAMDVVFRFDKQRLGEVPLHLREKVIQDCAERYGMTNLTEERVTGILSSMKTEIQTSVFMNDIFVGGIHRQMTERHMIFSKNETTEGCIPQEKIDGVIKVTIHVFNVIHDDTNYHLELNVE